MRDQGQDAQRVFTRSSTARASRRAQELPSAMFGAGFVGLPVGCAALVPSAQRCTPATFSKLRTAGWSDRQLPLHSRCWQHPSTSPGHLEKANPPRHPTSSPHEPLDRNDGVSATTYHRRRHEIHPANHHQAPRRTAPPGTRPCPRQSRRWPLRPSTPADVATGR